MTRATIIAYLEAEAAKRSGEGRLVLQVMVANLRAGLDSPGNAGGEKPTSGVGENNSPVAIDSTSCR